MKNNTKTSENPWNTIIDENHVISVKISIETDGKIVPWFINYYNMQGDLIGSKNIKE